MRQLLTADHVLTMAPGHPVIADGAVLIEDDRIAAVGPRAEVEPLAAGAVRRALPGHLVMPGLINAHCHSGLLRGTAEGLQVWDWLEQFINPMHRVLHPSEAEAASWLCYAESVLSGTTTVVDMWRFMDGSARAAEGIGNRLVMVPYVGAHPDYSYFDTLDDNEALLERWHGRGEGRIRAWVGLEHLFYTDTAGQRRASELARRFGTGLSTHIAEAQEEVAIVQERHGCRPVQALERLGLLESPALLAHCVWLDDEDIRTIARTGASVSHNPVSNMKLASGAARTVDLLAAGIAVGLGTDGEKENNNLDMFEEMKGASLLAKLSRLDATALDAWDALRMATIEGARAIGQHDRIGSLEPGKQADLIAIRTDTPRMTPLFGDGPWMNLHHNLVHAVRGSDVALTMVAGQVLVEDGTLKTADLAAIIAEARRAAPALLTRRAAWLDGQRAGKKAVLS
ncbi:MAG: amidohydrolase family protein [Janthinobacterium lividum]